MKFMSKNQMDEAANQVTGLARGAFEEIMSGDVPMNRAKEARYMKFISAAAKFRRECSEMGHVVNDPSYGYPPPPVLKVRED